VNKDIVSMYPSAGSVVMRTTTTKDLRAGTLRGSKAKFRYTKRERERERQRERETERERQRETERDRETETECERAKTLSTYQVRSSSARHPSFEVYSWRYRTKVLSEREEVDK
jgi:predicted  nucleic acid-binding Zn-ribbon protein